MSLLRKLPSPPKGKSGWPWTKESPELPSTMPNGKPWPKISIITPSFNQELFIEETIRSVLLQNYPNLEYLIIDGGSTDNSVEIIKKYEHWLTYWVSEKDRGQSHAINKGFSLSTGDILAWINSDDLLNEQALSNVANTLSISEPSWLIGITDVINSKGYKIYTRRFNKELSEECFTFWNLDWIPQQSVYWNREIQKAVGPLNENLHYTMDVDFIYKLYLATKPIYIEKKIALYRMQKNAKTISSNDLSIKETAEWIAKNILKIKPEINSQTISYICNSIKIQKKIFRIRNHIILGNILKFWITLFNNQLKV